MCVLCRPPSPVSAPKATQRVLVILFPHNVAFGPLLPFPSPPCPAPPFSSWGLGKHGPSSCGGQPVACLFLLQICSCARGAGGRGGDSHHVCMPGVKAGRGVVNHHHGLAIPMSPLWPFLFVFPRVNNDQLGIRLPAIIVGSS